MPALVLERCTVLHAPKTGGTWVTAVLRAQDLPLVTLFAPDGSSHPTVAQVQAIRLDQPIISTVREPVSWLRSFWRFFYARAWRQPAIPVPGFEPLLKLAAPTFAQFAARYLQRRPGYVTELQRQYLDDADWVCHQETLCVDLPEALARYGQVCNPASFRAFRHPRANVSRNFSTDCPTELIEGLREVDAWILEHFYGDTAHAREPVDANV